LPSEAAAAGAFAVAFLTVLAATPIAIRIAQRLSFYDQPGGYKVHPGATPYLGGAALVAGLSLAAFLFIGADRKLLAILGGAALMLVVGTADDRRTVRPSVRILATGGAAALLWMSGAGWSVFGNDAADLALTIVWVIGAVNGFNLMDNMDGAAATVAAVSGMGVAALALINGDAASSALALALVGACVGFLRYNLASPARIFLGDGGSMPIGFVLAAAVMTLPAMGLSGLWALVPAALLVGLVIFDTTLVIVSRSRRRVRIYSGARDHITHRLLPLLRSPRVVAVVLAFVQTILCGLAIAAAELGPIAAAVVAAQCGSIGVLAIWILERDRVIATARATGTGSVGRSVHVSAAGEAAAHLDEGATGTGSVGRPVHVSAVGEAAAHLYEDPTEAATVSTRR
jgi:UDP-GlcNAc:undecaprenyl-phosphate GlcNAc-1-phosphate transferase